MRRTAAVGVGLAAEGRTAEEGPRCDEELCVGCCYCKVVCPRDCIELRQAFEFKGDCTRCLLCVLNCPTGALRF